jgi:hypothetical protein
VCWKDSVSRMLREREREREREMINIPSDDFRNCFQQRQKRWQHWRIISS